MPAVIEKPLGAPTWARQSLLLRSRRPPCSESSLGERDTWRMEIGPSSQKRPAGESERSESPADSDNESTRRRVSEAVVWQMHTELTLDTDATWG